MYSRNHKHFPPEAMNEESLFNRVYTFFSDEGAEWNYSLFVSEGDLAAGGVIQPPSAVGNIVFPVVWNFLDAIYAIFAAAKQLLDEDDYHQTQNKVKAVCNILSGVQMLVLSYNPALSAALHLSGASALASPAFAIAMAADLVSATIDFCNAAKEVEFEGWLEERLKEADFFEERIQKLNKKIKDEEEKLEKLRKEIQEDEISSFKIKEGKLDKIRQKISALENKKTELANLKQKPLLDAIGSRCRVYCEDGDPTKSKEERKKFITDKCGPYLNVTKGRKEPCLTCEIVGSFQKTADDKDRTTNDKIQTTLEQNYKKTCFNLGFKSLSLVGMTMLAISPFVGAACPPLGVALFAAGMTITTGVALYYLIKNGPQMANTIKNKAMAIKNDLKKAAIANRLPFFKPAPKKRDEEEPLLNPVNFAEGHQ